MESKLSRCVRCNGRKKVYMINGGYTHVNIGGVEKICPLCMGEGVMKSISQALSDINEIKSNNMEEKSKEKAKHEKESKESKKAISDF